MIIKIDFGKHGYYPVYFIVLFFFKVFYLKKKKTLKLKHVGNKLIQNVLILIEIIQNIY